MNSQLKTQEKTYKGPRDLASILNSDDWSPTSLFPQPADLDRAAFPPKPQSYLDLIKRLSENGHPDLKYLCSEVHRQGGNVHSERSRAAVLEYPASGSWPRQVHFPKSTDVEKYLCHTSTTSCNRLYILEDISSNYVAAIGSHFLIEPSFWARHLRTPVRETSKTSGGVSHLPSIKRLESSISLMYPECNIIDDLDENFSKDSRIRSSAECLFADCNMYRRISMIRSGEFYDGIGVLHRRASVWSRTNADGTWDALILVDPPLRRISKEGHTSPSQVIYSHDFLKNRMVPIDIYLNAPYQGGYIDFVPIKDTNESKYNGPPRTSLFDDLIYYHTQPNLILSSPPTLEIVTFFLKKIVSGIWMNSISYISTSVLSLEYAMEKSRQHSSFSTPRSRSLEKSTSFRGLEWLEQNLFHIHSWKRRCSQMHDWAARNLEELEILHSQIHKSGSSSLIELETDQEDWYFIKKRLELYETCSRDIVSSALGLLSLIESHKSVQEAESARVLALLGTVYLPLSLTAGILSMGGSFTPGQSQFWVFFAVAGPLMVLSFGAAYMPVIWRNLISWLSSKKKRRTGKDLKSNPTFVREVLGTV